MIYGIRYSTDSRDRTTELSRFSSRAAAIAWRETQGPGGVGEPFGPGNGHRYLRQVYELHGRLPTGSRLIALMDRGRCSSAAAKAEYVMDHGSLVE
jgi:hypothetical protein